MPNTPIFEIPYPGPGDPNNPPADFYALAAWLEGNFPSSGTYMPSTHASTNVASATPLSTRWTQIGDIVTVSGYIDIVPIGAGVTSLNLGLPIPADLINTTSLSGIAALAGGTVGATVQADAAADKAKLTFTAAGSASVSVFFQFSYRVA